MLKKLISIFLVITMLTVMIPLDMVYAGTAVTSMQNVTMNQQQKYQDISYNFTNQNTPLPKKGTGPLYDDIFFDDPDVNWTRDTGKDENKNEIGYVAPGERPTASFGFCVDLKKSKLLGAARKGELTAVCTVRAKNYGGDGDFSRAVIIPYNSGGSYLTEYASANHDFNDSWGDVSVSSPYITKDAYYLIFSAYGERKGGVLNKYCDFYVNSIYGKINDSSGPKVVSISDTATVNGNQYIRQNINKNDPSIYITMDEDCTFGTGNKVMLDTVKSGIVQRQVITDMYYVGEVSSDNNTGYVTYKFRISLEDKYGHLAGNHFHKVKITGLYAYDTMGNSLAQNFNELRTIECNKYIDMRAPYLISNDINNAYVEDEFGLQKVTYSLTHKDSNIKIDVNKHEVGDVENIAVASAKKSVPLEFSKATITKTGLYRYEVIPVDLAGNSLMYVSGSNSFLFLIADSDPIKMTLCKNGAKFDLKAEDISSEKTDALTTMTLTADAPINMLGDAKVYYRWVSEKDDQLISKFAAEQSKWKSVSFKKSSNETEPLTIPVTFKSTDTGDYVEPSFEKGYLYVIPYMGDDLSVSNFRTGSMALGREYTDGKFDMLVSAPVYGAFVNKGCQCSGTTPSAITAEAHYSAIRNHTMDIGFDVDQEDNLNLDKIMWSIKKKDVNNSIVASGIIDNSLSSNKYDIPINAVKGLTGSYVVTVALYSNSGDVTVKRINLNIENPIIGISSIMYNQETQSLDFTLTYNKESADLRDIIIEISNKDITEFKDEIAPGDGSIYAAATASMDNWDSQLFIGTNFVQDSTNSKLMKANFRASLTNMEKAGDAFVKMSGEKRVHLKYVTKNNVIAVNNNVAVIRKSNIPPSVTMNDLDMTINKYHTASVYNDEKNPLIKVSVEEVIGNITTIKYGWVDNTNTSLSSLGGAVEVTLGADAKKEDFNPVVPKVEGDSDLYKIKYLVVNASNSFGKSSEKFFGPFYILNEAVNDKRFLITVTDKALGREKEVLIAVDDKLYSMPEGELSKANKMRVTWQDESEAENKVIKEYDLSFKRKEGDSNEPSNLALVNINYPELWDTDGKGGTYKLTKVEIYDSDKPDSLLRSVEPTGITQTLKAYYVTISLLNEDTFKVSSSQDGTDIEYGWSNNKLDVASSLTTSRTGIAGTNITIDDKGNIFNKFSYLFVKAWNVLFRSEAKSLDQNVDVLIDIDSIVIGEDKNGTDRVFSNEEAVPLLLTASNAQELNKIVSLKIYDTFSATSSSAISVGNVYKVSETQAVALLPSLTTSGSAIKCRVLVNNIDKGEYSASKEPLESSLKFTYLNKTIALDSTIPTAEYEYYKVYDEFGREYPFNGNVARIFSNGTYAVVYKNQDKLYAQSIEVNNILYTKDDIQISLNPEKGDQKAISPVTATISMPLGSIIQDKYGVLKNVETDNNKGMVIAEASIRRNAEYTFTVVFPDGSNVDYKVSIDYINENYIPVIAASTSSSAIAYDPAGPSLTAGNVKAKLNDSYIPLNNANSKEYIFSQNGRYRFVAMENNILVEHVAHVDWIDKNCPIPIVSKYVWNDKDKDKMVDEGEKTVIIPSGYKTKYNVITEITFPTGENARPVKMSGGSGFTQEEIWETNPDYAYKYVLAYSPENNNTLLKQDLTFEDVLGNKTNYTLIIDEIDRSALLTQLVYSTMDYTNRDVIVSMLSNKAIKRFENVKVVAADKTVGMIEKEASPTYVFKENGSKDFNYRELNFVEGAEEGKLTANVTWIDKSVPDVIVDYDNNLTNKSLKINFKVINGNAEGARLYYGVDSIPLTVSGDDLTGSLTVTENDRYYITITTKYGNTSSFMVPITNIDKVAPEISIMGRESIYIKLGDKYYDKGATAFDNRDKDISKAITVMSNVDTSKATKDGYYEVKYSVSDNAGNISEKIRKVYVLDINSAVAIVEDQVVNLSSKDVRTVNIGNSSLIYFECVGIEGNYMVKYQSGEKDGAGNDYDNAYFKTNGRFLSKTGTVAVSKGIYTFHVLDQERNTRIIKINFID